MGGYIITYFKLRVNQNDNLVTKYSSNIITYFNLRVNQNDNLVTKYSSNIITYFKLRVNQNPRCMPIIELYDYNIL